MSKTKLTHPIDKSGPKGKKISDDHPSIRPPPYDFSPVQECSVSFPGKEAPTEHNPGNICVPL